LDEIINNQDLQTSVNNALSKSSNGFFELSSTLISQLFNINVQTLVIEVVSKNCIEQMQM